MDTWDLLMEYFMMAIAGIGGGLAVAVFVDNKLNIVVKPLWAFFFLSIFFFVYVIFVKARERAKHKKKN